MTLLEFPSWGCRRGLSGSTHRIQQHREETPMGAPVVWFEVAGRDLDTLKSFYETLFGWKVDANNTMRYALLATGAAEVALRFAALARTSLAEGARLLKTLGDGVLIVAPDLDGACATAHRLRELVRDERSLPPVRIGICGGAVVWRDGDVFGATVNRAARLADDALPWEIEVCPGPQEPAGDR